MSAFLKVYTDVTHLSEVAHTTNLSTTSTGSQAAGTTAFNVASTAGMPAQGYIDILDGTNGNETLQYVAVASGTQLTLATATAFLHPTGLVVNQWYYLLAVGDQTNGILNDGTQATPTVNNTATWYVYNAGNQIAQSPVFATSNTGNTTALGFSDTSISITSSSAGFAASVSPSNVAVGGIQQIWVDALVSTGQTGAANPQICLINLSYNSV